MRTMTSISALAAGLFLATAGAAAPPLSYDCDTNEGSFSQLAQDQPGPAYRVRGTITPLQSRTHERFLPSAQVRLESRDRTHGIAVQLVSLRRDDHFDIVVALGGGTSANRERTPAGTARMNEAVPFDMTVSARGDAVVTVGSERLTFLVDLGPGARLYVICSTGEFDFQNLEWGAEPG
jgi:hypothetical protein